MATQQRASRFTPNRRSLARLYAVQTLYQVVVGEQSVDQALRTTLHEPWDETGQPEGKVDGGLLTALVRTAVARRGELETMVGECLSVEWSLERLETLLRLLLVTGAAEMLERPDTPARVIISEYVALADDFFQEGEPRLVNAVLDRLARVLRPETG